MNNERELFLFPIPYSPSCISKTLEFSVVLDTGMAKS